MQHPQMAALARTFVATLVIFALAACNSAGHKERVEGLKLNQNVANAQLEKNPTQEGLRNHVNNTTANQRLAGNEGAGSA